MQKRNGGRGILALVILMASSLVTGGCLGQSSGSDLARTGEHNGEGDAPDLAGEPGNPTDPDLSPDDTVEDSDGGDASPTDADPVSGDADAPPADGEGDPSSPPSDPDPSTGGGVLEPPARPCAPLGLEGGVNVGNFLSDRYTWRDAECTPRSAALVRNTGQDPAGAFGGYARVFSYDIDGQTRTCVSNNGSHPGFGYLVNHISGGSVSSRRNAGSYRRPFTGRHHAIHEFTWSYSISGKPVDVTVQWFFATGRDHPVWAVTFDTSRAGPNAINADSRGPYGDIQWDGGGNTDVAGVGWGDRYKFRSLGSPITLSSGWDYSEPNTVPYVLEYSTAADAEMGLVQTQTYMQHDAGGYGFYTGWRQRDDDGPMPADYNWPYQLNQYELPWGSTSKRLAWGMNYGAVGQTSYPVYGNDRTASGYPYQSYSVHIVLDRHSEEPVAEQVREVEHAQGARLSAAVGTVRTKGPAGVGRSDEVDYNPSGYNHIFGTFEVAAAQNEVDLTLALERGALMSPTFVISSWTGGLPESVKLNGDSAVADVDYYASLDSERDLLWITVAGRASDSLALSVR